MGHKIIGDHIQNGLLRKIIKVKLDLKPNTILAERAQPFSAKDPYVLTQYPHTHKYDQKPENMEKPIMMDVDPVGTTVLIKIPTGASALVELKTEKDGNGTYKWKYRPGPSEPIQTGEGKFIQDKGLYDWAAGYDSYLQAGGIFIRIQGNILMFYGSRGHVTKLQAGDFDKDF